MTESFDGKRVLIVDDDPDILEAIRIAFSETGAVIDTAQDGNMAIEIAAANTPDLVVLDAMLPKRSGFLVLEKIKAGRKGQRPFVIMITGNPGQRHKSWAQSLGVDDYLNKPFRMDRLMEKAVKLLNN
ncbi:MAG: putative transcriptional regulatory protein TcrX [Phycisphaerae bacterium]|nr:putative transcriptional regulatory protein TcrX [Phycisphaerae bacterium]